MNDTNLTLLPSRYEVWLTRILHVVGGVFWLFFCLGQLERMQLSVSVAIYAHDAVAVLFILLWLLRERSLILTFWIPQLDQVFRKYTLAFIFAGWITVSTVVQTVLGGDVVPIFYLLRIVLYVLFITVLCILASETKGMRKRLYVLPVLVGSTMAWFGAVQYLFLPDTRFLATFGWDDHYYRMIGTIFDPNYLGLLLILTAIASWRVFELGYKKIGYGLVCILTLFIFPTFSRGSYATALLIGGLVALQVLRNKSFQKRWLAAAAFASICVASVVIALLPKPTGEGVRLLRTSTIEARVTAAQQELGRLDGEEWLLGTGLYSRDEQPTTISHARLPDNILITVVVQTGIIGTVLGSIVLFKVLRSLAQFDTVAFLAVTATLFHSLGTASLLQPFILLFLLLIVGTRLLIHHSEWFVQAQ